MEGLFNPFSSWLIVTIISVMAACEVVTKKFDKFIEHNLFR